MENKSMSNFVTLEENLLSLFFSGLYLTNYDFFKIGEKLNFEIPLNGRETNLKTLIKEVKDKNRIDELKKELLTLVDSRIEEYTKLSNSYENTSLIIKRWIEKADNIKKVIEEKLK